MIYAVCFLAAVLGAVSQVAWKLWRIITAFDVRVEELELRAERLAETFATLLTMANDTSTGMMVLSKRQDQETALVQDAIKVIRTLTGALEALARRDEIGPAQRRTLKEMAVELRELAERL